MVQLIQGDCLQVMRGMDDKSVDIVITDPPYGCAKAAWDDKFPTEWYKEASRVSNRVAIITGSAGLKDSIALVGEDFIDVIAAWNLNSRTRGPIGFSNWLACVIAGGKPRQGQNHFEFAVRGKMPNHPTPKPIEYMRKLVARLTEPGQTILDPFMGSGTTGVACIDLGRSFIGIEIEGGYFDQAQRRIDKTQLQEHLPIGG